MNLSFKSKDDDIFVEADWLRLSQVFDNILRNAIKFTAEGDITIAIQRDEEYGGGRGNDNNNYDNEAIVSNLWNTLTDVLFMLTNILVVLTNKYIWQESNTVVYVFLLLL